MAQRHIMIDTETLGTGPDAVLLSIGAVLWEQDLGTPIDNAQAAITEELALPIDATSAQRQGGTIEASTVLWWLAQDRLPRAALLEQPRLPIDAALGGLAQRIGTSTWVWANSPSFDLAILRSAYGRSRIATPWHYWHERDYRTLARIHASITPPERFGIAHDALDDARHQAAHTMAILGALS